MAARVGAMFGMDPREVLKASPEDWTILVAAWKVAATDEARRWGAKETVGG